MVAMEVLLTLSSGTRRSSCGRVWNQSKMPISCESLRDSTNIPNNYLCRRPHRDTQLRAVHGSQVVEDLPGHTVLLSVLRFSFRGITLTVYDKGRNQQSWSIYEVKRNKNSGNVDGHGRT